MAKKTRTPQPRLVKVALEARMKPELRRFALLHTAAAELEGYPDWTAGFTQVRLTSKETHSSLLIGTGELRYLQDSSDAQVEQARSSALTPDFLRRLGVSHLLRMGHRRWYLLPLDMTLQEAVALFFLRYYPQEDPVRSIGHEITDVLYRADSSDADGWKWHVTFAPVLKAQAVQIVEYDLEAHWQPRDVGRAENRAFESFPEVGLYADLDCYRDGEPLSVEEWGDFCTRSRAKAEEVAGALFASFLGGLGK